MKLNVKQIVPVAIAASLFSTMVIAKSEILQTNTGTISEIGDWMQIIIPTGAMVGSLAIGDTEGAWQLTKGLGTSATITHGLKFVYRKMRPDGTKPNSFPSGHTSAAFAGAAYLHHRYGDAWAVPAYGAAVFVGFSRVHANRHFIDDVMAGGAISVLTSLYFTEPYHQSDLMLVPSITEDGFAVNASYVFGREKKQRAGYSNVRDSTDLRNSYSLFIGGSSTKRNSINDGMNIPFDLYHFGRDNEPNTYAASHLTFGISDNQYINLSFTPYESRTQKEHMEDVKFKSETYLAGNEIVTAYSLWNATADYMFELLPDSNWKLDVGVGLSMSLLSFRMDYVAGEHLAEAGNFFVAPSVATEVGYQLTDKLSANLGMRITASSMLNSQDVWSSIDYKFNHRWAASIVVGSFEQQVESKHISNDLSLDYSGFNVKYSF
ncbi:phosphatase PAP2 family protein [Shewanella eurypsychrophilus]|uniref:undecaprenyl-diphosphate phosphatase n=1 Tax=Shewanella eurypsychrophilus TaxID=2593656 RepID=A0ABX6V635_9GAMM|nr:MULTISPECIES: phosphatase PAP2 family protein [Shewanella]QFU22813.1 phosphatase PAP2 family protein [Shewanella sp. YLB-09]QPG58100.1 phosphatase PAP2 family protein [Shewanella eurypsychrophilus]